MNINIEGMSLLQALNAVQKLQTFLDQSVQDRIDFTREWSMRENATENGTFMAYMWKEECIKHLLTELREAIVLRFDPPPGDKK